ncbi:MAG: hypothetical protein NC319_06375 [Butyricicoccus sp.]|nr:hypothetical protein [Butyricicoccus sp.]
MIRATTGGVLKSYRSNLMSSFTALNKSRDTVLSQRVFNSYAEDPATAAKAFKLRKSRMATQSQYNICSDTYKKYQTAWSCLDTVDELIDTDNGSSVKTIKATTLKALNDPTGDAREQLAKALDQMSETIVQTMNQKYGDNFIFAGADGHNVPFEVREVGGQNKLFYRGVDVDAAVPLTMKDDDGDDIMLDENGNVSADGTSYLSTDAELVKVPVKATSNGTDPIMVNGKNELDGAGEYFIVGYDPISEKDYNDIDPTERPNVVVDATGAPVKDGNGDYILINDNYETMTQEQINAIKDKAIKNDDGSEFTVTGEDGETKYYIVKDESDVITREQYQKSCDDAKKLERLAGEKYFVDIGLGFQEDKNGNLIESSGYNASLVGLNFIGYGKDADGDPKNIYSIVQKLKDIAGRVKDGQNWSEADYDEFNGLVKKLERASSEFKTAYTNMDAGTTKLKNNVTLLEENFYNLQEQYSDLEDVDMADSITSFVWAQYCYNAALKVGNSILSESLMDYLS